MLFIFGGLIIMAVSHGLYEPDCYTRFSIGALITKPDLILKGHQKESLYSLSYTQCSLSCLKRDWCISINFEIRERKGKCQLNDYGVEDEYGISVDQGEFKEKIGYVYSQLRPHAFGCHNNLCINGGRCSIDCKDQHRTQCTCPKGFLGSYCEVVDKSGDRPGPVINFNKCAINPCLNNGACIAQESDLGYSCECTEGYEGERCETIDEP